MSMCSNVDVCSAEVWRCAVRQALQEAMQVGCTMLSKHGVAAFLPACAAIVAAADPIGGRFLAARTLQENLKLSPSLLACFDLVFALQDEQTASADHAMASRVLRLTTGDFACCTAVAHVPDGVLPTAEQWPALLCHE